MAMWFSRKWVGGDGTPSEGANHREMPVASKAQDQHTTHHRADFRFLAAAPAKLAATTLHFRTIRRWSTTIPRMIPPCSITKQTKCLWTETAPAHLRIRLRKPTHYHPLTTATSRTKKTGEVSGQPLFDRAHIHEHPVACGKTHIRPTWHPGAEAEAGARVLRPRLWPNQCPCGLLKPCITIIHSNSNRHQPQTFPGSRPAILRNEKRCRRC